MYRLLQGDVGSGKTIIALRAMLAVVDSGGQAALLAPTEVLAQQHYRNFLSLLKDLAEAGMIGGNQSGIQVRLLTGSTPAAQRREVLSAISSGQAGITIGTHALLGESVNFKDLGLIVIDEQHRFGVEQRDALRDKAREPAHVLVMKRACEEVGNSNQVYVVAPRISADDESDLQRFGLTPDELILAKNLIDDEDSSSLKIAMSSVEELYPMLTADVMKDLRVGKLHGRLSSEEKEAVMQAFVRHELDVLVTTTVIEVGVDVANATMMIIMNAERFGVSQLHQLRGRIGRGVSPGLCLFVTSASEDSPAMARLKAVAATTDGFELSRLDLQERSEGDVLGSAQSGARSHLRLLRVIRDEELIAQARLVAENLLSQDPTLSANPELAKAVEKLRQEERAAYLEKR